MLKISIIVPVYKVEKYIGQCIESLQIQTLKDIEIIIIDDGSPDKSGVICDQYARTDERIKVIHKENAGVSAARNDGLDKAKGDYVIFIDSDDYLPIDALEKLYTTAKAVNADIVIGDVCRVKNGVESYAQFYDKAFVTQNKEFIDKLIRTDFYNRYCPCPYKGIPAFGYGGPCNKLVRRTMLENNNINFDIRVKGIFDDIIYSAYILAHAKCVAYITELVYYYRILDSSITQTYKMNMIQINAAIFEVWEEFLTQFDVAGKFTNAYYANVLRRFDDSLSKYFFSSNNPKSKREKMDELQKILRTEPYCLVNKNIDKEVLSKWHKILIKQMEKKSAYRIWIAYKVIHMLVKLKNKI